MLLSVKVLCHSTEMTEILDAAFLLIPNNCLSGFVFVVILYLGYVLIGFNCSLAFYCMTIIICPFSCWWSLGCSQSLGISSNCP